MVDKSRLQVIGWLFAGATAGVMVIAGLLVGDAVASNWPSAGANSGTLSVSSPIR